jgi:hypothetical protein
MGARCLSGFGFRHSFVIRASSFGFAVYAAQDDISGANAARRQVRSSADYFFA